MTINSRDPKGDVRHTKAQPALLRSSEGPDEHPNAFPDGYRLKDETALARTILQFTNFDHGYLKMRRASLGSDLHLTWTWTLGSHAGSYVYVRVDFWQVDEGLRMLAQKILQVDEGHRIPTVDKRRTQSD